jgi:hypothetical protein
VELLEDPRDALVVPEATLVPLGPRTYVFRVTDSNGTRVERGSRETRTFFRGNGMPMVGIGIIKQSTANTLEVARAAKAEMARRNPSLPEGTAIRQSDDSSVFVEGAGHEVYKTLFLAVGLVVLVIYLFLGSVLRDPRPRGHCAGVSHRPRRARNVAAEPLELLPLPGLRQHSGVQGEA